MELRTGWFEKMVGVGWGRSQGRRKVKKEKKKIIGVNSLKSILQQTNKL